MYSKKTYVYLQWTVSNFREMDANASNTVKKIVRIADIG